jgi:Flp pilus assembly protein TadG
VRAEPTRGGARRAGTAESGQAIVEVALVVPLLLLLAFGVVGAGRVTHAQLAVSAVAREAARVGALAGSTEEARARATARGQQVAADYRLDNGSLRLEVDARGFRRGGEVRAAAAYEVRLDDLPLLGWVRAPVGSAHAETVDPYRSRAAGGTR